MPLSSLESLQLPIVEFTGKEIVFRENRVADSIYILIEGKVRIHSAEIELMTVEEYGSFFGQSSVLLGESLGATVETLCPSKFYHIENASEFLLQHTDLWYSMYGIMKEKMRHDNHKIIDLQHKHCPVLKENRQLSKLQQWVVLTNDFFDRDILHPLKKTDKQHADEEKFRLQNKSYSI